MPHIVLPHRLTAQSIRIYLYMNKSVYFIVIDLVRYSRLDQNNRLCVFTCLRVFD